MAALHARTMVIPQIETARRARQRRGDRRGARRGCAVARPFRSHQFHGHSGRSSSIPTTSTRSMRIVAACEAHGKAAAFLATDDAWARDYAAQGLPADGVRHRPTACCSDALRHGLDVLRARRTADDDCTMTTKFRSASRATSSIRAASPRSAALRSRSWTNAPGIEWEYLPAVRPEITPTTRRATTRSTSTCRVSPPPRWRAPIAGCEVVARHGVGYDSVDVAAMTRAGVIVTNTPMLDAAAGRDDRADVRPRPRRQAVSEGSPHAHRPLARADGQHGHGPDRPHARRDRRGPHRQGAAAHGADLRPASSSPPIRTSMRSNWATSVRARSTSRRCCASRTSSSSCCLLNDETRHLIGAAQFALMTPDALISSTSRAGRSSTKRR